jgi:predicted metal-dependent HD superfamily phosphohydrolase
MNGGADFWRFNGLVQVLCNSVGHSKVISDRSSDVYDSLKYAYTLPSRHYHSLDHIAHGLDVLDRIGASLETKFAWWFHDKSYIAGSPDNESQSAHEASWSLDDLGLRNAILPNGVWLQTEVNRLILLTKDHRVEYPDKNGGDIVTADLHGLAAPWDVYENNTAKIRREFGAFSDEEFRTGRIAFLEDRLLRNVFPYGMEYRALEGRAGNNMRKELEALKFELEKPEDLPYDNTTFINFMTQNVSSSNGGYTA